MRKLLLIPDCHIPSEDKRAFNLMLQVGRRWKPDDVVILGDFANCGSVSPHEKTPRDPKTFKGEVEAVKKRLNQIDALAPSRKFYVQGNHEFWLERYINRACPELQGLVAMPELLGLEARGYSYTPYRQHLELGHLYITHEAGNAGANAHRQAGAKFQDNVVIGHTHRLAIEYSGNAKGKAHVAMMCGWLGDVRKVEYAHRIQAMVDWQLGFGIGHMQSNGVVHLQAIPIVDYRCVVDGKGYNG